MDRSEFKCNQNKWRRAIIIDWLVLVGVIAGALSGIFILLMAGAQ